MNITLVPAECNKADTIFCPLTTEEFLLLQKEGLIDKKTRSYRMVLYHHEIQVECPVLINGNRKAGVIMPAFKLPYRPYPCYVYLFAVALYLAGDSMRKAAGKVQKKFGIPGFSHSTISRVWTALQPNAGILSNISGGILEKPLPGSPALMVRTHWTQDKRHIAALLFGSLSQLLVSPELGTVLAYQYFMRYCRLLI